MATVNFFIRTKRSDDSECSVWASVFASAGEKGSRVFFQVNTRVKVMPSQWNRRECRAVVLPLDDVRSKYNAAVNSRLDDVRARILADIPKYDTYNVNLAREVLNQYKNETESHVRDVPFGIVEFTKWIVGRMESGVELNCGQKYSKETTKQYKNMIAMMTAFSEVYRQEFGGVLCWKAFARKDVCDLYMNYLDRTGYSVTSRNKYVSQLEALMNIAYKKGVIKEKNDNGYLYELPEDRDNMQCKVYLTDVEIQALYNMPLVPGSWRDRVRDVFLCGCYCGQRVSDYGRLTSENFRKTDNGVDVMEIVQAKTGERVVTPILNENLLKIVKKYNGVIPRIHLTDLNRDIKLILKDLSESVPSLAETHKTIQTMKERRSEAAGNKQYVHVGDGMIVKHKYDLVSSHTARRSCITNLYKKHLCTDRQLMSISGHKKVEVFYKYVLLSGDDVAEEITRKLNGLAS